MAIAAIDVVAPFARVMLRVESAPEIETSTVEHASVNA
jgi:hypothetical protein